MTRAGSEPLEARPEQTFFPDPSLDRRGFTNVEIQAFEEAEGALAPDYASWRFPWTVIIAARRGDPVR